MAVSGAAPPRAHVAAAVAVGTTELHGRPAGGVRSGYVIGGFPRFRRQIGGRVPVAVPPCSTCLICWSGRVLLSLPHLLCSGIIGGLSWPATGASRVISSFWKSFPAGPPFIAARFKSMMSSSRCSPLSVRKAHGCGGTCWLSWMRACVGAGQLQIRAL